VVRNSLRLVTQRYRTPEYHDRHGAVQLVLDLQHMPAKEMPASTAMPSTSTAVAVEEARHLAAGTRAEMRVVAQQHHDTPQHLKRDYLLTGISGAATGVLFCQAVGARPYTVSASVMFAACALVAHAVYSTFRDWQRLNVLDEAAQQFLNKRAATKASTDQQASDLVQQLLEEQLLQRESWRWVRAIRKSANDTESVLCIDTRVDVQDKSRTAGWRKHWPRWAPIFPIDDAEYERFLEEQTLTYEERLRREIAREDAELLRQQQPEQPEQPEQHQSQTATK
jgi:hypothetical protein